MKYYFSGVMSTAELDILREAGASRILLDLYAWSKLSAGTAFARICLDSGAYRAFKNGGVLDLDDWASAANPIAESVEHIEMMVAPDVIGNPELTRRSYERILEQYPHIDCIPVWQWGASEDDLQYYLDRCEVVGLGGLVPYLRSRRRDRLPKDARKAWDEQRHAVLEQVIEVCQAHPGRFHFFGLGWPPAIKALKSLLYSADGTLWLYPARYGLAVFANTQTGRLSYAPANLISDFKSLSRRERLVLAVQEMETYFNTQEACEAQGMNVLR
jgi:hypothetical protein